MKPHEPTMPLAPVQGSAARDKAPAASADVKSGIAANVSSSAAVATPHLQSPAHPPGPPEPPAPQFATLWAGYPEGHPDSSRWPGDIVEYGVVVARKGELKYSDQCAIKVSVALHAAGVDLASFRGATTLVDGKRMALRAAELAAWLDQQTWAGAAAALRMTGSSWQAEAAGRTGIIYFANYWRRAGESAPTGDHIDLWQRDTLTPSMQSILRFRLGIDHVPNPLDLLRGKSGNWYSDLGGATEVVLWPIA